jgi:uncharacterized protein (TIGR00297 family)
MSSRLSRQEVSRKLVHIGVGAIAFALVFLGPAYSALCALAALLGNLFLLPRVGGRGLWRTAELERGHSLGIVLYPAAVLLLILVFWRRLEVAAAVWGILALGDGMASLAGKGLGGRSLPWNSAKSWVGSLTYWLCGGLAATVLLAWTRHHQQQGVDLVFLSAVGFATALCAAAVESLPLRLDDNISVPILAGPILFGLLLTEPFWATFDVQAWLPTAAIAIGVNLAVGLLAWRLRSIDSSGLVAGVVLGGSIWAWLGWKGWSLLLAFFVLGTAATKLGYQRKAKEKLAQEKGGRRGAKHALANTAVAAACAFFAATTPYPLLYLAAFAGAFATAGGDTLASEIGQLWGRRTFLITTLRAVPRGTDGAVSVEGTLAGVLGSLLIALVGFWTGLYPASLLPWITLAAFLGTTLESVVGATLEKRALLDNEAVNFLNTLIGAALAAALVTLMVQP